ncbi:MAG: ATP-binding protein [Acidimicrobiales bacterium]
MNDGTEDQVRVSFPASPVFSRVGRVAVAGLALRLGIEIADVEKLRLAVDEAVAALHGKGRITLSLRWQPEQLTVTVDNPDEHLDSAAGEEITETMASMVDHIRVGESTIDLTLLGMAASKNGNGT